jgi:hypothetical protein
MAYNEGPGDIRYLDDKTSLKEHNNTWARLTAGALDYEASRAFLQVVYDEYRQ